MVLLWNVLRLCRSQAEDDTGVYRPEKGVVFNAHDAATSPKRPTVGEDCISDFMN